MHNGERNSLADTDETKNIAGKVLGRKIFGPPKGGSLKYLLSERHFCLSVSVATLV